MNTIKKLLLLLVGVSSFVAACTKLEDLPFYLNGNPVVLTASKTAVTPAVGDSNNAVISFSWTNPKYSSDSSGFKYILEIDSTGRNFAKKVTRELTGGLTTSFTGREINTILLQYGLNLGTAYNLDFRVVSSYNNNNERYTSNILKIAFTPYADPSVLTASTASTTLDLNSASQKAITFNWTGAFKGYVGNITYSIQYDSAGKNFANPKNIAGGVAVFTKDLNHQDLNQTALDCGVPGGNTGKIEYRVKAVTAAGATAYSNTFAVTIKSYFPLLRFYMPGSYQGATGNGNDWDPGSAPELIRDLRPSLFNDMYYIYLYLPAGALFKFTQGRAWDINLGGSGGVLSPGGSNLTVATSGYYRITINRRTLQYDIKEGRMGFVGGSTGAGWDPGSSFPNYSLGLASRNLFVGLTTFTTGGWKLIDNNQWNNGSNTVGETRSYGSNGGSGSTMDVNGANFPDISTAGRYRVIWDGRNVDNIKYEIYPATEMRLVGDGIDQAGVNAWDPGSSPQMTYAGDGVWTITVKLFANKDIKFLAGNAWGAFDYEDNSGQSQATGVAKKIKWEGGNNFKTPTVAGTYTITLDEKSQTATIN
jgi:hypothetical protein